MRNESLAAAWFGRSRHASVVGQEAARRRTTCRLAGVCAGLALLLLLPVAALAQEGQIAGLVRDSSGGVLPGVTVTVTSPALIEGTRSTVTDDVGQYRITNLAVGTYSVTFELPGFTKVQRDNVVLTTGFTAPINATMPVGQVSETVSVQAETPTVDVQSPRQVSAYAGDDIRVLPTSRTIRSLMSMTPAIVATGLGEDCVGGAGVWCNGNIYNLAAHAPVSRAGVFTPDPLNTDVLSQGRIMVDGQVINAGSPSIQGLTGGYSADIANAQEVTVQVSGALGESETGGVQFNIVPRTGGNRFSGHFFASRTEQDWFSENNGNYPTVAVLNTNIIGDYDVQGSVGGPIKRDHLWFYSTARTWKKEAYPGPAQAVFNNLNIGKFGANYEPDWNRDTSTIESTRLFFTNTQRNVNARITWQATPKNKFNIFWDEQDTCLDPCDGTVSTVFTPEAEFSGQVRPSRLVQVGWTNPISAKLLMEAGLTLNSQFYDYSRHRYIDPSTIRGTPRISEFCLGAAGTGGPGNTGSNSPDFLAINNSCQLAGFGMITGPLNSPTLGPAAAEYRDNDDWRTRASLAYVSGTHNAKFGWDGGFYSQVRNNSVNDPRLNYRFDTPASATCYNAANPAASTCGNTSLYYPNDPYNQARRPVPSQVTINTGTAAVGTHVNYNAFYVQDQWTLRRFTLSGALRYDHATSNYLATTVGPDIYVPVQGNGTNSFTMPAVDGVSFNDITPRFGVVWDVSGTGRTAVKFNMGKYLAAATIDGIYASQNLAARAQYAYTRTWIDGNGNRRVDCNLLNFAAQSTPGGDSCGGPNSVFGQDPTRYGQDPLALNAAGQLPGLATTNCGSTEVGIPASVQTYCDQYGDSLLEGWGRRRNEWQLGIGVQHELVPRLSVEVSYNRTSYGNFTRNDILGIGCDQFGGAQTASDCQQGYANYTNTQYDFFTFQAPQDARLPGGGGYVMRGLDNPAPGTSTVGRPTAVTIVDSLNYSWNGVDVNVVWRAPGGFRINAGTSTGRSNRNTCAADFDGPSVRGRDETPYRGGCDRQLPFQTNLRGSAAYTVPKIDVLVSTVFQYRPGVERSANVTVTKEQVTWEAGDANRATAPCVGFGAPVGQTGCFTQVVIAPTGGVSATPTTATFDLLNFGEMYGEPFWLFDLKFAKNVRVGNKRFNIGVDVYNLFNNDAIRVYNDVYTIDNPATPAVEVNSWGNPMSLLSPRFVRLQFQFDF
jgi:hypothetical protein